MKIEFPLLTWRDGAAAYEQRIDLLNLFTQFSGKQAFALTTGSNQAKWQLSVAVSESKSGAMSGAVLRLRSSH